MLVRHETYIFYGVQLPYNSDDSFYEKVENLTIPWCGKDAKGKVGFLFDGMNSKYIIFGYVIDVENEYGECFQNSVYSFDRNSEIYKNINLYRRKIFSFIETNDLDNLITYKISKDFKHRNFEFLVVSHYH